jgi:predicted dehydrogenase
MSKKYSVVVVGLGKRGGHHTAAFQASDRFEVTGICDIDEDRLAKAKAELGGNVEASTDAAALTASLKPDVFCFCTMPHLREPFIKMGIDGGAKLIAFEKPVADSSAAGMAVRKLIDSSGVKAVVSHQHRYGPHYAKVAEIARSGALGNIHTIYASAPGWMMHMASHMIDYMREYNGNAAAQWVMAQAAGDGKLGDNHPSPDYIAGFVNFANGARGVLELGAGAPNVPEVGKWWGRNRIRVMGDAGFAEVLTNGGWRAVTADGVQSGDGVMDYAHDTPLYVQDMARWLDDDRQVHPCNFQSAYEGMEIMAGLMRSVIDGGQVALPLTEGRNEIEELREKLAGTRVLLASPDHAAEYQ